MFNNIFCIFKVVFLFGTHQIFTLTIHKRTKRNNKRNEHSNDRYVDNGLKYWYYLQFHAFQFRNT